MKKGVSLRAPALPEGPEQEKRAGFEVEATSPGALVRAGDPPLGPSLCWDSLTPDGGLRGCLACGHPKLYTRKEFPRALGIAIVVLAAALAPFTWYLSLVAAALLGALLVRLAPEVVRCYRCQAEHRGFFPRPRHPRFDREIAERLSYGEKAVMGRPRQAGGTADAPEPER